MEVLTCHYCSVEMYPGDPHTGPTKDHIVPRALGGRDERFNIIMSCRDCNSRKADDWPTHGCNRCRKARRIHWEENGISEFKNKKTK
jgi:5-methylcytosine-specific restriction endonuclease McrA